MNTRSRLLVLAMLAALASAPAMSDKGGSQAEGGKGGKGKADVHNHTGDHRAPGYSPVEMVVATISATQARRIASSHQLVGQQPLPPGIRKNLARGKPLPPGIAKSRGIPAAMLADLPRYEGYEWQRTGTDLVLVSAAGAVIADILVDVFE